MAKKKAPTPPKGMRPADIASSIGSGTGGMTPEIKAQIAAAQAQWDAAQALSVAAENIAESAEQIEKTQEKIQKQQAETEQKKSFKESAIDAAKAAGQTGLGAGSDLFDKMFPTLGKYMDSYAKNLERINKEKNKGQEEEKKSQEKKRQNVELEDALESFTDKQEITNERLSEMIQNEKEMIDILKHISKSGGMGGGGGNGGGGPSIPDLGEVKTIWDTIKGAGKSIAGSRVGGFLKGAAIIGALGYATDASAGALGIGKDKESKDLEIDKKQDDKNWNRMSFGQKLESGFARGIEKTGDLFFLNNLSRQAQYERVKNESEYFQKEEDKRRIDREGGEATSKPYPMSSKPAPLAKGGLGKHIDTTHRVPTGERSKDEQDEINRLKTLAGDVNPNTASFSLTELWERYKIPTGEMDEIIQRLYKQSGDNWKFQLSKDKNSAQISYNNPSLSGVLSSEIHLQGYSFPDMGAKPTAIPQSKAPPSSPTGNAGAIQQGYENAKSAQFDPETGKQLSAVEINQRYQASLGTPMYSPEGQIMGYDTSTIPEAPTLQQLDRQRGGFADKKLPPVSPGTEVGTDLKNGSFKSQAADVTSKLMKDFDLTKEQAAGIVGNLGHESAGLQAGIQEKNPIAGKGGLGWAQWTGPRRRAFEKFLQDNNMSANDPNANYAYLKAELSGQIQGSDYSKSIEKLKKTKTLEEATESFEKSYEGAGIVNMGSRNKFAAQALELTNAQEQQKVAAALQPKEAMTLAGAKMAAASNDQAVNQSAGQAITSNLNTGGRDSAPSTGPSGSQGAGVKQNNAGNLEPPDHMHRIKELFDTTV